MGLVQKDALVIDEEGTAAAWRRSPPGWRRARGARRPPGCARPGRGSSSATSRPSRSPRPGRRACRPSRSATSRGTGSTATWRARVPALAEAAARAREAYARGGPPAAAAVRGGPARPSGASRTCRSWRGSRRWGRPRPGGASASTSAPLVLLSFGGLGLPGLRPAAFGALDGYQLPAHRPGGGRTASRRTSAGSTATRWPGGRPRLPGPRRRGGRGGDEARLRDRHGLHRRGHAARLHGPRRLPGVPGHGGGDAALPAGGLRVERRGPRGAARPGARGRARAAVPGPASHRRRRGGGGEAADACCRAISGLQRRRTPGRAWRTS